ncbi:hypothetical protein BDR26DRAFT_474647 [Obelidium mucronatum]|nr:hypothetical protein BDR26DRAFT_474647 [Obelidium mucronatum]
MSTFGASGMTENMNLQQQIIVDAINRFQSPWGLLFTTDEIQRYFNINQMFTCPMLFAHGLHNLLKDPSLTIEMASTRKLNGYMNSTLFMKTGYRGILGDPVQLTRNGDLATSYTLSYCEGTKSLMTTAFASTDIDSTRIEYIDGQLPIFFDGTSIPPLDGPVYETLLIWPDSQNAFILKIFAGVGVFFAGLFLLLIAVFQRNPAIRSGSVPLMSVLAAGSIPSYVSNLLYIGRPSVYKCHLAVWLQSLAFAIMSAAIIFKNLRVGFDLLEPKRFCPNMRYETGSGCVLWVDWLLESLYCYVLGHIYRKSESPKLIYATVDI